MRSLWIFTAVVVAALLLFATSLMVVLIGVGFLALGVVLMFWPVGFRAALRS